MLKTFSAALLAMSVLAAPAMPAGTAKNAPVTSTAPAPAIKPLQIKSSVLNANAKMGRHHHRHHRRFHKHFAANKAQPFSKVTAKHVNTAVRRG